jgi:hypothetical protein
LVDDLLRIKPRNVCKNGRPRRLALESALEIEGPLRRAARDGVPERVLETGAENDRLVTGVDYRRATPEAALLHWLYLSGSSRSRMSAPPLDLDLGKFDLKRLKRLAAAMRLDTNLCSWRARNVVQHA